MTAKQRATSARWMIRSRVLSLMARPTNVQDLFLGVDGLSPVQWHPYSTVGGERPHTLVAHIKAYGQCVLSILQTYQMGLSALRASPCTVPLRASARQPRDARTRRGCAAGHHRRKNN